MFQVFHRHKGRDTCFSHFCAGQIQIGQLRKLIQFRQAFSSDCGIFQVKARRLVNVASVSKQASVTLVCPNFASTI